MNEPLSTGFSNTSEWPPLPSPLLQTRRRGCSTPFTLVASAGLSLCPLLEERRPFTRLLPGGGARSWTISCKIVALGLASLFCGCAHDRTKASHDAAGSSAGAKIAAILEQVRQQYAPDPHIAVFEVRAETVGSQIVLIGEVSEAETKASLLAAVRNFGRAVQDEIQVLPDPALGEKSWGIVSLSVATGREKPNHKAEMGTQISMGHGIRILKANRTQHWLYVQSSDRYLSWVESGAVVPCTKAALDEWNSSSSLLIVTNYEDRVVEEPRTDAAALSDIVMGNLLKRIGDSLDAKWFLIELPDGRKGFLPQAAVQPYAEWRQSRKATPENIERTGRLFMGRPYLWGGTSSKAFDCSGFCQLVFFLNGIELNRNAGEQALQGTDVPLTADFAQLRKGDLLFFGWRGRNSESPLVTHVAIYLGDRRFIQSSQRVRISSLDPASPDYDSLHARSLLFARRLIEP